MNIKKFIDLLSKRINYCFLNENILKIALTHKSYSKKNNENFEFLGDAILNFVISTELIILFPVAKEGDLSRMRSNLVNKNTLSKIGKTFKIGEYICFGKSEIKNKINENDAIISNCIEALICAIYYDSNCDINVVRSCIKSLYKGILQNITLDNIKKDSKTFLQEYLQSIGQSIPLYKLVKTSGAEHKQKFEIECTIPQNKFLSKGIGPTIRIAEQNSAQKMIKLLNLDRKKTNGDK